MIAFRPPVAGGVLPPSAPVPPVGTFRVTQRFSDLDSYWSQADPARAKQTHNAVDIGNRRCGDPILAMAAGIAYPIQDNATAFGAKSNALGVRIIHAQGYQTEYWHLASQSVASGQTVSAGQEIGKLGATGLGAICHTHITLRLNGVLIDPESYITGQAQEDDVWRKDAKMTSLRLQIRAGAKPYADPSFTVEHSPGYTFPPGTELISGVFIPNVGYGVTREGGTGMFWVKTSDAEKEIPLVAVDCTAAVNAAVQPLQAKIIAAKNALG